MSITDREFDAVVAKLGFHTRQSDHKLAWFEYDGKVIARTRRSNKKGPLPMEHAIRQQMKLNNRQLREAIRCTFGLDDYVTHLKDRGHIPPGTQPDTQPQD